MIAAAATLALESTPARLRLIAAVEAAIADGLRRFPPLTAASVYLTAAHAGACDFRWKHFAKADPPRVLGLPVRVILGRGTSRVYCKGGSAIGIERALHESATRKISS